MNKEIKHIDKSDDELSRLLKEGSFPLEDNDQWFTRRVLNRLPERRRVKLSSAIVFYGLAAAICVVFWVIVFNRQWQVITVRDVVYTLILMMITAVTAISPLTSLFSRE